MRTEMPEPPAFLHVASLALEGAAVLIFTTLFIRAIRGLIFRHTKRRALRFISGPARGSLLAGNLPELFNTEGFSFYQTLAQYGGVAKLHGLFGDVLLVISDPHAVSHVLTKEPYIYTAIDISGTIDTQRYILGPGLLATNGAAHKEQRKMLNPVFSASHVKRQAPLMHKIATELRAVLAEEVQRVAQGGEKEAEVEVAEWLGRASLEMISQSGIGHTFRALQGEGGAFLRAVKEVAPAVSAIGPLLVLFVMTGASSLPPTLLKYMGRVAALFIPSLRKFMDVVDTVYMEMCDVWEKRKKELRENPADAEGSELLSVLLGAKGEGRVPDDILCAQAETLIFAGTETTSTALCRILHLLALHPHIQDRLRAEINTVKDGAFDYDHIASLPFLDAIIKETLRVYAPLPFRNRRSTEDSFIPLANGTAIHIPAGTEVLVDVHGLNIDARIWGADAYAWKPERWLNPLPESVVRAKIPGVYPNIMTFLGGPKACIGFNFTIVEMKTVISALLPVFSFDLPERDEIEWRFGPIVSPSVKGEKGLNPKMPLKVMILAEKAQ